MDHGTRVQVHAGAWVPHAQPINFGVFLLPRKVIKLSIPQYDFAGVAWVGLLLGVPRVCNRNPRSPGFFRHFHFERAFGSPNCRGEDEVKKIFLLPHRSMCKIFLTLMSALSPMFRGKEATPTITRPGLHKQFAQTIFLGNRDH